MKANVKSTKGKVLIVEDESVVALDIQNMLERLHYEVAGIYSSGAEALRNIDEILPDLILMDIMLQGEMDGVKTAQAIYHRLNIPIVYITAYADESTLRRAIRTEPFGYLLKPFNEKELQTTIEIALYKYKLEKTLREREQWLATLLRSIGDAVIATDREGKVTFMNPVAEKMIKRKQVDALKKPLQDVFQVLSLGEEKLETISIEEIIKSAAVKPVKEGILLTKDKKKTPMDYIFAPIIDEKKVCIGVVLVFRDITERKRSELELNSSREQLRNLSSHLQSVREEERRNMAREIHDELGQALTALKMDVSWLSSRLPKDKKALLNKVESMTKLMDMTLQIVKRLSSQLRPGLLDDLGLSSAIEWQAQDFQERTGIECDIKFDPEDIVLDEDRSTALFRIFQETLTNIARHAKATRIQVSLIEKDGMAQLEVKDNGKGITQEQILHPGSFGLIGMRERVHLLNGKLSVEGEAGKGTTVFVSIPLK